MTPPFLSTFTLFTEIIITAAILYVFYRGYKYNKFPFKVAFIALAYEILFNVSYMSFRALTHDDSNLTVPHSPLHTGLAIFHGTFSLIMFML